MEEAQPFRGEIPDAPVRIENGSCQAAFPDAAGHRVDREIAPAQVLVDRRRSGYDGETRGRGVLLAPGGGNVYAHPAGGREHRGSEAGVLLLERPARQRREPARELERVRGAALDGEVHVPRRASEQQVAERAADEPGAHLAAVGRLPDPHEEVPKLFCVGRPGPRRGFRHVGGA